MTGVFNNSPGSERDDPMFSANDSDKLVTNSDLVSLFSSIMIESLTFDFNFC